jgi:hypothetical protein
LVIIQGYLICMYPFKSESTCEEKKFRRSCCTLVEFYNSTRILFLEDSSKGIYVLFPFGIPDLFSGTTGSDLDKFIYI